MRLARESDLLKTILDYLRISGILAWRNNTGAMSGQDKGKRWYVRFSFPGAPDIFAVKHGQIYGIEVKSPRGELSALQVAFSDTLRAAGGCYVVARSLEDVTRVL